MVQLSRRLVIVGHGLAVAAIACADSTAPARSVLVPGRYALDSIGRGPGAALSVEIDYADTSATFTTIEFDSITVASDSTIQRRVRTGIYSARDGGPPQSAGYVETDGPARLIPRGDELIILPVFGNETLVSLRPDGDVLLRSISSGRTRCDGAVCHVVSAAVLHARYRRF